MSPLIATGVEKISPPAHLIGGGITPAIAPRDLQGFNKRSLVFWVGVDGSRLEITHVQGSSQHNQRLEPESMKQEGQAVVNGSLGSLPLEFWRR